MAAVVNHESGCGYPQEACHCDEDPGDGYEVKPLAADIAEVERLGETVHSLREARRLDAEQHCDVVATLTRERDAYKQRYADMRYVSDERTKERDEARTEVERLKAGDYENRFVAMVGESMGLRAEVERLGETVHSLQEARRLDLESAASMERDLHARIAELEAAHILHEESSDE